MVRRILGLPESSKPPIQVDGDWWDADSWDELQRRLERSRNGEAKTISDEEFVRVLGMTAEGLIRSLNMSDEEIQESFGMPREELVNSLGLPHEDEDRMSA